MKFPSIHSVVRGASRTFLRFPLPILLAVVATVFCIWWVHVPFDENEAFYWLKNAIAAAYLGMLLSVALTVLAEKKAFGPGLVAGLRGGVVALTLLYYFSLPDHFMVQSLIRFVLYALGLHWLIACIAFTGRDNKSPDGSRTEGVGTPVSNNGFWVYNKKLFLRILTSALYTLVLYAGLMLAVLAIDKLFNVHLNDRLYAYVWWVLAGIFNTWFFLAGFPADYESPAEITDYPRGLKIFTQFVLLPILTVYLFILYAYLFRIIFTAVWPYGWVAYLVLGFSVAGILSILLVWPLREEEDNKWISGYSRFFYIALFPLIIMLFIAIWKRVAAYGITELRYFVLLLAAWLLFIALYFLASKRKNIQLIPLSLCVMAFLVSFGPWGSAGISLYSQQQRLKSLLVKNGRFADGKVTRKSSPVSLGDRKEISSITEYIVEVHGYQVLRPWYRQNMDSMMRADSSGYGDRYTYNRDRNRILLNAMGVEYASRWEAADNGVYFYIGANSYGNKTFPINGYDQLIPQLSADTSDVLFQSDKGQLRIRLDSATNRLILSPAGDSALPFDLSAVINAGDSLDAKNGGQMPVEQMTVDGEDSRWSCRLLLQTLEGIRKNNRVRITHITGNLLLRKK